MLPASAVTLCATRTQHAESCNMQAVEAVRKNVEGRRASARSAAAPPTASDGGQGSVHGGSIWTSPNGSAGISPMKFAALKAAAQDFQRQVRFKPSPNPNANPNPNPAKQVGTIRVQDTDLANDYCACHHCGT